MYSFAAFVHTLCLSVCICCGFYSQVFNTIIANKRVFERVSDMVLKMSE